MSRRSSVTSQRGRRRATRGLRRALAGPASTRRKKGPPKALTSAAMLFVAALFVGATVPANAFLGEIEPMLPVAVERPVAEGFEVSADATPPATLRDEFDALSRSQVLTLKYSNIDYASIAAPEGSVIWPFPQPVPTTDGFGYRGTEFHFGLDMTPGIGTPIYAIADGTAIPVNFDPRGFGQHVKIQHNLGGVNVVSVYGHMLEGSSPIVGGQEIHVGDFLGLVGETGRATGPHLHLEIRVDGSPVDPQIWMGANASYW